MLKEHISYAISSKFDSVIGIHKMYDSTRTLPLTLDLLVVPARAHSEKRTNWRRLPKIKAILRCPGPSRSR